ncbi:MAG: hypothetical protein OHK0023_13600 [Anaerolineae bacterium]
MLATREERTKRPAPSAITLMNQYHERNGYSLREMSIDTGLHFAYICQVLNGKRKPSRDAIIALCAYGWGCCITETNQVLEALGYCTLGNRATTD